MSTILKALRRLEEEKASVETGRPLREQIAAASAQPPPRSRRPWIAAGLALVTSALAGGGLIWWIFGDERVPGAEQVATAPAARAPARPPTAAPVMPESSRAGGPPEDAFASDVEIVPRPDALPRLADAEPVQPRVPPQAGARRPVEDSVAAARAREAALTRAAREEQLAEMDRLVDSEAAARSASSAPAVDPAPLPRVARPTVAEATVPEPEASAGSAPTPAPAPVVSKPEPRPAPVVPKPEPEPTPVVAAAEPKPAPAPAPAPAAAPSAGPAAIPIRVERTRWHPLSERRSAWLRIEGEDAVREFVEGDVVAGTLVQEIQPSGVVFDRDGEQTRRGVGER